MIIIDGRKLSKEILGEVAREVAKLSFSPVFCDVLVGEDPSSMQYVRMKQKTAESVGIKFHSANFPSSVSTEELIKEIKVLNKIPDMCGIIIQLPLPPPIDKQAVLDAIDPELDVDCLGKVASDNFYAGNPGLGFPTALAALGVLDSKGLDLKDKNIVVLGQGMLVGQPVTALLKFRGLNPIVITSKTPARNAYGEAVAGGENKEKLIKNADVIISGIGQGRYLTRDMVKEGVVIIDAGTSESSGGMVGDVDASSMERISGFLSPVPGGVGPVTVAMLLRNVLEVAKSLDKARDDFTKSNK